MKTKTISVRCPLDMIGKIDLLCQAKKQERSTYIVRALRNMLTGLEKQGICCDSTPNPDKNSN